MSALTMEESSKARAGVEKFQQGVIYWLLFSVSPLLSWMRAEVAHYLRKEK